MSREKTTTKTIYPWKPTTSNEISLFKRILSAFSSLFRFYSDRFWDWQLKHTNAVFKYSAYYLASHHSNSFEDIFSEIKKTMILCNDRPRQHVNRFSEEFEDTNLCQKILTAHEKTGNYNRWCSFWDFLSKLDDCWCYWDDWIRD